MSFLPSTYIYDDVDRWPSNVKSSPIFFPIRLLSQHRRLLRILFNVVDVLTMVAVEYIHVEVFGILLLALILNRLIDLIVVLFRPDRDPIALLLFHPCILLTCYVISESATVVLYCLAFEIPLAIIFSNPLRFCITDLNSTPRTSFTTIVPHPPTIPMIDMDTLVYRDTDGSLKIAIRDDSGKVQEVILGHEYKV